MTVEIHQGFTMTETGWRSAIVLSAGAVIALTVWCLSQGITTTFMHLYYIPLVLLAYHYRRMGIVPAVLLSMVYLVLVLIYAGNSPVTVESAFFRTIVFIAIAALVAYLAETLGAARDHLNAVSEIREGLAENANVWMMVLDKNGRIHEWNRAAEEISGYFAEEVMGKNAIWKRLYPVADYRKEITGKIAEIIAQRNYLENLRTTITCKNGSQKTLLWNTQEMAGSTGGVPRYIAIGVDITDRVHAEEVLQKSEHRSAVLLEAIPDLMLVISRDGTYRDFHVSDLSVLAMPPDRIIGTNIRDSGFGQESVDLILLHIERALKTKLLQQFEYELVLPQGKRQFEARMVALSEDTVLGIIRDITERRLAEDALRESEEKYRTLIEKANEAIIIAQDGNFAFANPSMSRLLGVPADELTGKPFADFVWPDDRDLVTTRYRKRMAGEDIPDTYDFRVIGAEGKLRWVFISAAQILWQGRPATLNLLTDVTERRLAEDLRKATEFRLDSAMEIGSLAWWEMDMPTGAVRFDARKATMLGYSPGMFRHYTDFTTLLHPDDLEPTMQAMRNHLDGKAARYQADYRIRVASGEYRWFRDVGGITRRHADGTPATLTGIVIDITAAKRADEALRESDERFRQFFNNINDALYLHAIGEQGLPGKFIEVNDVMCERLGYTRHELLQLAPQDIVSDAGRAKMPAIAEVMAGKGHATFETEHRRKDGSIIPVEVSTVILSLAGTRVAMASARDITERKRAAEALTQSEERYRTLAEASPDQIFINDRSGIIQYANSMGLKLLGLPYDQVIGKHRETFFPPEMIREQDATFEKVFDTGESLRQEVRIRFGEREEWIDTTLVPLKDAAGHINAVLGVARDITERKRMEDALRESRQLFSDIISFLPDPTLVIDREGKVLAWNRALEQLSGIPAEDMLGKGDYEYSLWQYGKRRPILIDLVQNPDQDAARMNYFNILHEGTTVTAETQLNLTAGRSIALFLIASPLYDVKGSVIGAIESMRDITRIKETEAELARLNENLERIILERTRALQEEVVQRQRAEKDVQAALDYTRSVIEANPDLMVILDLEGKILDINTAGETLTGIPKDQLIGTPYFSYLVDDGTLYTAFSQHLETGWTEKVIRIQRADGHTTPLSVHATMIKGTGTSPDRIIVSAHDITRQKQDEAAIQASLDEKVLLLREIHHRVKNNLQIIISLTNLQIRTIEDPEMKQILAETRNRVRAMSLVHERLYMSGNLSSIDLSDYTKYLASQLFSFYGVDHTRVALHTDIEKIPLDIDTAIPLGLVLNELISNALKHAFPDGRNGIISISGHLAAGDVLTLVVRDNGAGMPQDYNWKETDSLGLRLISGLVDQVGGTIEKGGGEGTMFIITIHRKPNRESSA